MGENYAGSQYIAYTTKIRAVLKELPSFAGDFFRGIENDTLVRTRYAYAVDMRTFIRYCWMDSPNSSLKIRNRWERLTLT